MRLTLQASDAEEVLPFSISLHNPQVNDSVSVAFQTLVK
jgi:hypothetical protein